MPRINFIFGVHNHQPLGNFEWIIKRAYEKAYRPFLETLEEYPNMKVAVHISGVLVEWLERNRPEYIDLLKSLIKKGQVELVVAGFYEPILVAIPEEDRVEQIKLSKGWARKMGYEARGLWLTERVWEPELVKTLREAGIEYVILDDYHFMSAGLSKEELFWPYYTENGGEAIVVFPIDEKLRYLIPFRPVNETLEYLHSLADEDESKVAVFHDDGEKFGAWPGTHELVYERGWLKEFFDRISSDDKINLMLYSEYLSKFRPKGLVYLPIASYFEMSEWSLPARQAKLFFEFIKKLKELNLFEKYRIFVRGGIWKNFLYKYPEGNYMHKRMLMLSKLLRNNPTARIFVLRAQCNDAYWHGVFGGIYLPHIRRAVWRNLIKAHSYLEPENRVFDLDFDGGEEIMLENENFILVVKPHYGGAIFEMSSKKKYVNYLDVVARRWEHYHSLKDIPEGMKRELSYDKWPRGMLQDHFLLPTEVLDNYMLSKYRELGDFLMSSYHYQIEDKLRLWRSGKVKGISVEVEKVLRLNKDGFTTEYRIVSKEELGLMFGVEINLAVQGTVEYPAEFMSKEIEVKDIFGKVKIESEKEAKIWKFPIKH